MGSCIKCGAEFPGPGAFCSSACRKAAVRDHEEYMIQHFRRPGSIWPGDTVRLKTPLEKALEEMDHG